MIDSKIDIFFFDVDWTLLDHNDETVHELTYQALDSLKKQNRILCMCSSRSPQEATTMPSKLLEYFDVRILGAGTYVEINGNKTVTTINQDEIKNIIDFLDNHDVTYRYCTESGTGYINREDRRIQKRFERVYYFHPDTKKYDNEKITTIMYYTDEKTCEELENTFKNIGHSRLTVGGEIYPTNLDKGAIMLKIAKDLGYSKENIFAIGDGLNDRAMIEQAQIGVAMGNSPQLLKDVADYTTKDVKDDGVYFALKHYNLI